MQQLLIDKIYDNFFHLVQGGQPVIFLGNGSKTQRSHEEVTDKLKFKGQIMPEICYESTKMSKTFLEIKRQADVDDIAGIS